MEDEEATAEVAEEKSAMSIEDGGVRLQQQRQHKSETWNVPYEVVGDDEMEDIERAFLQAHSVSSAFRSMAHQTTVRGSVLPGTVFGHPQLSDGSFSSLGTQSLLTSKPNHSFVYTVATDSLSSLASAANSTAGNGSLSCSVASASNVRFREGAPSSALEYAHSSQSPMYSEYQTVSEVEDADKGLSEKSRHPVVSEWDESSTPSLTPSRDVTQVSSGTSSCVTSSDHLSVVSANSSVVMDSAIQGQVFGDSQDMEDFFRVSSSLSAGGGGSGRQREAGRRTLVTLLQRKSGRGLSVTDFTASEWCEKQVEYSLNRGKPEQTPVMKAGIARHIELEKEVITRVEIEIHTKEDTWAVRLLNFISGTRQLLSEGLTRELPVLGVVGGTWVVGIIDEIRLVQTEYGEQPLLVDTKTRKRQVPPSEAQKRNGRLQLMCYKILWDTIVETGLPSDSFFKHFRLNPHQRLSQDVKSHAASLWFDCEVQCLQDLIAQITIEVGSHVYPKSVDTLILRYEWQEDQSLLGEDEFQYEHEWLLDRWQWHSEFWAGHRAASFVPEDEAWKCRYCSFASVCLPAQQSTGELIKEDMLEHGG